jgi:alcohol dehydrogenase class IV
VSSRLTRFSAPTRIVAGLGAIESLGDELADVGHAPVAVVCDRGVADAGLLDEVLAHAGRRAMVRCTLVGPDPSVTEAEAAVVEAQAAGCRTVLGVGGGSALGVAKAVALRLANHARIDSYAGRDQARHPPAPSIAVPTTAGSGSEVSNALVLQAPERERLLVVRGRGYEPDVALLDGNLLASLPRSPMLHAALDALTHALEALWVQGSGRITDVLALEAARGIRETLPSALEHRMPDDLQRLLEASTLANLACGNTGLGLVHALSSATSVRLPHGYQNGVLLPHVAAFNRPLLDPRAAAEADGLPALYERLGFDATFGPGEVSDEYADAMVAAALDNPFAANNRRAAASQDLQAILDATREPVPR